MAAPGAPMAPALLRTLVSLSEELQRSVPKYFLENMSIALINTSVLPGEYGYTYIPQLTQRLRRKSARRSFGSMAYWATKKA